MRRCLVLPLAVLAASLTTITAAPAAAQEPVAQTPPMGWNSWNYFAGKVDDMILQHRRSGSIELTLKSRDDPGMIVADIVDAISRIEIQDDLLV